MTFLEIPQILDRRCEDDHLSPPEEEAAQGVDSLTPFPSHFFFRESPSYDSLKDEQDETASARYPITLLFIGLATSSQEPGKFLFVYQALN